jgi:hypothetical protein
MFLDFASKPIGRISRKREPAELQFANPPTSRPSPCKNLGKLVRGFGQLLAENWSTDDHLHGVRAVRGYLTKAETARDLLDRRMAASPPS